MLNPVYCLEHSEPAPAGKMVAHPVVQTSECTCEVGGHIECNTKLASVPPSPVPVLVSVTPSWPVIQVTAIPVGKFFEA